MRPALGRLRGGAGRRAARRPRHGCTLPPMSELARTQEREGEQREWMVRALLVLQAPRPVFAALRDDSPAAASARAEPVLALVLLAGMALLLLTPEASTILDSSEYDAAVFAVWLFIVGGVMGMVVYWLLGGLVYVVTSWLGSLGSLPARAAPRRLRAGTARAVAPGRVPAAARVLRRRRVPARAAPTRARTGSRSRCSAGRSWAGRSCWSRSGSALSTPGRGGARSRRRRCAVRSSAASRYSKSSRDTPSSKRSSSSSSIEYACSSSGNAPVADVVRIRGERVTDLGGEVRVALDEAREVPLGQPEQVVVDEHLPVAAGARADPDRRDRERLGDPRRHRAPGRPRARARSSRPPPARARRRRARAPALPSFPACGTRPAPSPTAASGRCAPITGMPASTIARTRETDGPPPSSLTTSAPPSLTKRIAVSTACSSDTS